MFALRSFILLILLTCGSIAGNCQSDDHHPELTKHTINPPRPDDFSTNIKRIKKELADDPKSAEIWTELGWNLYSSGRYGECKWVMAQARLIDSKDPYILWLSGLVAYVLGDYQDCRQFLESVYFNNKYWPKEIKMDVTYDLLGRLSLEKKDLFSASYYFGKAADTDPKNWQYFYLLGFSEWYRFRYYESAEAFKQAKALNRKDPNVLSKYAWALAASIERWGDDDGKKDYGEVISAILDAIKANPSDCENYELLGLIYVNQKKTANAKDAFREAIVLNPRKAGPRFNLAKILLQEQSEASRKEGESQLIEAIAISPEFWQEGSPTPCIDYLIAYLINNNRLNEAQSFSNWAQKYRVDDE